MNGLGVIYAPMNDLGKEEIEERFQNVLEKYYGYCLGNIEYIIPPDDSRIACLLGIEMCNWLRSSSDIPEILSQEKLNYLLENELNFEPKCIQRK